MNLFKLFNVPAEDWENVPAENKSWPKIDWENIEAESAKASEDSMVPMSQAEYIMALRGDDPRWGKPDSPADFTPEQLSELSRAQDIRATRKHGLGDVPPPSGQLSPKKTHPLERSIDKALFKIFGIRKEHKGVPHDIPEFIPHSKIPNAMIRNPEYAKLKQGGIATPGEVPLGEGTTLEEGGYKEQEDTFNPEIEGKRYFARRSE